MHLNRTTVLYLSPELIEVTLADDTYMVTGTFNPRTCLRGKLSQSVPQCYFLLGFTGSQVD